ncbi:dipeptide ABC transporter ATP-binding protein [Paeniglutamicibacter gangotriensis]|uniref:ABC transporter n=2 Tax=Paeniglutamicibacter gangotriensis TaxID=254787 RepID=M7N7K3_9MICC|nr:ABC transporter ATP-binding protein [Paeniglutamicibacter gangotriensis]EMQ97744.1 ABC transporter [Paeniglutamicibacter gangotriensis Lz1y]KAA0974089.1 ABC transporter ATP-binding protein [Paeniglutamicibacter gangotriensis]
MTTNTMDHDSVASALCATDVRVQTDAGVEILHGVSFTLQPGRILALVGESGSGKTTAGLACMGHFRQGLAKGTGTVHLGDGEMGNILELPAAQLRGLRGKTISYVPQDPALSLNPSMRIGEQITETLRVHRVGATDAERRLRVTEVLAEVGLANDPAYQRRYPHQLSGGQQQRVGIAMAFACRPSVIVLDEPTTGLDVTTQAVVLRTIDELAARHQVAGLYITHDLAVVAEIADEVAVMLEGDIVEHGATDQVLFAPQHSYTRRLLAAVPDLAGKRRVGQVEAITGEQPLIVPGPHGIPDSTSTTPLVDDAKLLPGTMPRTTPADTAAETTPLLRLRDLSLSYGQHKVLDGIDFQLREGESMMLLGESGSGKTTLSRCVAGLNDAYTGSIELFGEQLATGTRSRSSEDRRRIQYVFQSPFSSLNPRRTIAESVGVPLQMSGINDKHRRRMLVLEALDQVRLGERFMDRRPGDLSGGERQRAAIARALVNAPSLLVCDEITSALDVSVQASILDLLRTLQTDHNMSMLFVTHNIALARHISQRLAVLQKGKIVDFGTTDDVLNNPQHSYTQELLANVPAFD